jgi:hypothetical protein
VSDDGCCEHNLALQAAIVDARSSRWQCSTVWPDLINEFGSISHVTIFISLQRPGLYGDAISVICRLYAINTTNIRSHQELTLHICIQADVKQGCTLSPMTFNLTMEPIILAIIQLSSGYSFHGATIHMLSYADDLTHIWNLGRTSSHTQHSRRGRYLGRP